MKDLIAFLEKENIQFSENESMKNHTTFKVGGEASVMIFPKSEQEVSSVVKACKQLGIRLVAIGNGSNLLVSDNGIHAAVLCFSNDFSDVKLIDEETVFAESGASLMKLCRFALENSLSGLEFAFGIPGSCGGAAFMNAGAYGGEMKDVLVKCTHID
ncbi:MAG: FAD-binding protein, partial [Eubacterium sp.]|nr:FAD-binding protein [Eubacterium sp.]